MEGIGGSLWGKWTRKQARRASIPFPIGAAGKLTRCGRARSADTAMRLAINRGKGLGLLAGATVFWQRSGSLRTQLVCGSHQEHTKKSLGDQPGSALYLEVDSLMSCLCLNNLELRTFCLEFLVCVVKNLLAVYLLFPKLSAYLNLSKMLREINMLFSL